MREVSWQSQRNSTYSLHQAGEKEKLPGYYYRTGLEFLSYYKSKSKACNHHGHHGNPGG